MATTIAHDSFKQYMYGTLSAPADLTGAIVSTYYAGNCIGSFSSGAMMDRWGRKSIVFASTVFAIIGTAIQAGSVNVGMMIAGRTVAGMATGALLTIVPIYIAELSPPENRAFLVALKGLLTAIGYLVANWIGYAGSFAVGDAQWRIPLAMQVPPALLLLLLTVFLPNSPRWRKCFLTEREDVELTGSQSCTKSDTKMRTKFSRRCMQRGDRISSRRRWSRFGHSWLWRRRSVSIPDGPSCLLCVMRAACFSPASS